MPKIFVTRAISEVGIDILREKGYEVEVSSEDRVLTQDELIEKGKGRDAILSLLTDKITPEVLDSWGDSVKIVANYAVGFDNIDLDACDERGIAVSNTPGVVGDTVAEHAMGLMLAISHRVVEADGFMRAGKYHGWKPMMLLGTEIKEKTLGIVGLGEIGMNMAHMAHFGFEMDIIYNDIRPHDDFDHKFDARRVELNELLEKSDYVSLHVPLLPSTKHLIGAEEMILMKPEAFLINTSRGPVIDEEALVAALTNGHLAGAALDVF